MPWCQFGVPFAKTPITVYSDGITDIIAGIQTAGIKRLVCVTSSVVASYPAPLGGMFFEKVAQPHVVKVLGKSLYDDMRRMETTLHDSDLAWTIVRPSGLFETYEVSPYEVALDTSAIASRRVPIWPIACSAWRLRPVGPGLLAVATATVKPNMLKLIWREGICKKK